MAITGMQVYLWIKDYLTQISTCYVIRLPLLPPGILQINDSFLAGIFLLQVFRSIRFLHLPE